MLGTKVVALTHRGGKVRVRTGGGAELDTDLLVWTAGAAPLAATGAGAMRKMTKENRPAPTKSQIELSHKRS